MSAESDSGATEPSGSSAGVDTELAVAKTPGPGSGEGRSCSPRKRSTTSSFCVFLPLLPCRSVNASTIAPTAAVISSAEVSSNGKRYFVKIRRPSPSGPPPVGSVGSIGRAGVTLSSARATPVASSPASPIPSTVATSRCPRRTSTTESELSRPTSISTNRNSIMIAPV